MSRRRRRHSPAEEDESDRFASTVEAVAVLLDAGLAPVSAWEHLGRTAVHPFARDVAELVAGGSRIEDALTSAARTTNGEGGPRALVAAWAVASAAGSPLGPALRGTADALRDRADVAREVEVALSGPRSTARVMGWLPVGGLGLAFLVGVDLVDVLTSTPLGPLLLGAGAALTLAGRGWTSAMVREASPRGDIPGTVEELMVIALASGSSIERSRRLVAEARSALGFEGPATSGIDEILELASTAGAPATELLASAAARRRRDARAAGRRGAAELGVRLLLPLSLCVLPAFLLLGVAPVILGLIASTVAGF